MRHFTVLNDHFTESYTAIKHDCATKPKNVKFTLLQPKNIWHFSSVKDLQFNNELARQRKDKWYHPLSDQ